MRAHHVYCAADEQESDRVDLLFPKSTMRDWRGFRAHHQTEPSARLPVLYRSGRHTIALCSACLTPSRLTTKASAASRSCMRFSKTLVYPAIGPL